MSPIPEISIITVNYNGFRDTCELIDSLHEHIRSCTYETIVIDNGSRQDEAILLQKKFPDIKVIRSEKNLGFAGGNNLGFTVACGKYILLLNNDTIVKDDSLCYLRDLLDKQPDTGAVSPKIRFAFPPQHIQFAGFTPLSKFTLRNYSIGYNEEDCGQYDTPHSTPFLHGAAMMFRRDILGKVGHIPEIYFLYYEEMDWCCRFINLGYQLQYEPRCTVYHKESCSTGSNSPLKTYYLHRNRLLFIWRNRKGISRWVAIIYLLYIAVPKNIMINLLKGKMQQASAILKGCLNFFLLRNKMN